MYPHPQPSQWENLFVHFRIEAALLDLWEMYPQFHPQVGKCFCPFQDQSNTGLCQIFGQCTPTPPEWEMCFVHFQIEVALDYVRPLGNIPSTPNPPPLPSREIFFVHFRIKTALHYVIPLGNAHPQPHSQVGIFFVHFRINQHRTMLALRVMYPSPLTHTTPSVAKFLAYFRIKSTLDYVRPLGDVHPHLPPVENNSSFIMLGHIGSLDDITPSPAEPNLLFIFQSKLQ